MVMLCTKGSGSGLTGADPYFNTYLPPLSNLIFLHLRPTWYGRKWKDITARGSKVGINCLNAALYNAKTVGELLALPPEINYNEIKLRVKELWLKTGVMKKIEEERRRSKEKMSHCYK